MKPTKYEPMKLLNKLDVGDQVSLALSRRPSVTSAITRLHKQGKRFETKKMDTHVFTVKRLK